MIPYETARALYLAAQIASIVFAFALMILYARQGQNILLQSCCVAVILLCAASFYETSRLASANLVPLRADFRASCFAVAINFLTNVVHAHLLFLMLDSCAQACGWQTFRIRKGSYLTIRYLLVSYAVPSMASIILLIQEADIRTRRSVECAFHYSIYQPGWATRYMTCTYAYIGSFFSIYLLFRTTRLRISSLDQNLITQLSLSYMVRINTTTFIYLVISMSSVYPLDVENPNGLKLLRIRRPSGCHFIVASIGVLLFAMFGFGSPARRSYKEAFVWLGEMAGYSPDYDAADLEHYDSFTIVSEADEEELVDFEDALITIAPDDPKHRYRGWSMSKGVRRSSDPPSRPSHTPPLRENQHPHSKLSEAVDMA